MGGLDMMKERVLLTAEDIERWKSEKAEFEQEISAAQKKVVGR